MKKLKGACVVGQSGGPTAVINSSISGVVTEALRHPEITEIYAAKNGIAGILNEEFYDMRKEDYDEFEFLKNTPSSVLGSVRHKLKSYEENPEEYEKILDVFRRYDIRYFFYNGGNDSMDTCNKLSKFFTKKGYECRCIGIPKTIDNDLAVTDHCPGFGSAAKYVATTIMEVYQDTHVYNYPVVTIVEVMGRNAGWLTASAALATPTGSGPDLLYLPEVPFELDEFVEDIRKKLAADGNVLVVISEGVKFADGRYVSEFELAPRSDAFGHKQLGGLANKLAGYVHGKLGVKVRPIEFSLLQRCAAHVASRTDINEAYDVGVWAVQAAVAGHNDKMVTIIRKNDFPYVIEYGLTDLDNVANHEKQIPAEWLTEDKRNVNQKFIDYCRPLIRGKPDYRVKHSLPRYAKLRKILVEKKK